MDVICPCVGSRSEDDKAAYCGVPGPTLRCKHIRRSGDMQRHLAATTGCASKKRGGNPSTITYAQIELCVRDRIRIPPPLLLRGGSYKTLWSIISFHVFLKTRRHGVKLLTIGFCITNQLIRLICRVTR